MCRSCADGGRRCPKTEATRAAERAAAKRYYRRTKARRLIAALADDGLSAMDDLDCPVTYHLGPSLDLSTPPPLSGGIYKPAGLWTAPGRQSALGGTLTAWTDEQARNGMRAGAGTRQRLFEVKPQPGAVILRIDTRQDLENFVAAFPEFHRAQQAPDADQQTRAAWDHVKARGVDGVMLTERGQVHAYYLTYQSKETVPRNSPLGSVSRMLEPWHVGSTVWFHNDNLEAREVELGGYPIREPEDTSDTDPDYEAYMAPDYDVYATAPEEGIRYDEGRATDPARCRR